MPKLTQRAADAARPSPGEDRWFWDGEVVGFGLRVRPSGAKTFVLRYSLGRRGASRRLTIGRLGSPWTVETARAQAQRLQTEVQAGADPAAARAAARGLPTVAELGDRYLEEHAVPHKAPSSAAEDARMLARVIKPSPIARLRVDRVTPADVAALHHARRHVPTDANRALALLGKMFALSETWGQRPRGSNPVRGIKRFRETRRERFLSEAELAKLGAALSALEAEDLFAAAALRLLILTGARRSEILKAQWSDVSLEAGTLRVQTPKEGKPKLIRLGPPALKVLASLPRVEGNPYVIGGRKPGRPLVGIGHIWAGRDITRRNEDGKPVRVHVPGVRDTAGLADVRLHDLRHSFASVAVAGGASLPMIGALLGHRQPATTQRYAHLSADPLRKTADTVSARIASVMAATARG